MQASEKMNGAILSARHSFMPNRLGYCGPDENDVLYQACLNNEPTEQLTRALKAFQGAYPYLRFIAQSSGREPFDYKVTEAYWIGNDLLERISPAAFYEHLRERLRAKFPKEHVKKFFEAKPYAAFPHHALHVFNAFSTMGTVQDSFANASGPDEIVGRLMDKCRISWGKVVGIEDEKLIVEYEPIERREGRLSLGKSVLAKVVHKVQGRIFVSDAKPDDWISFHWDFACSKLSELQVANLRKYTLADMHMANTVPVPE